MTEEPLPTFNEAEKPRLVRLLYIVVAVLGLTVALMLALTFYFMGDSSRLGLPLAMAAAGTLGSAIAALVSCLNRQAGGFEDSKGGQIPAPQKGDKPRERFNERMFLWFLFRPLLGTVMSVVVYWGFVGKVFSEQSAATSLDAHVPRMIVYGFLAGVFAKSLLDILRELPKNIFKQ